MVRYYPEEGRWRTEGGQYTSPPPEAENRTFDAKQELWRWEAGHPQAGQFAPNPEPDRVGWSMPDTDSDQWINTRTGEKTSEAQAINRNRNLERAQIFKALGQGTDVTYQELQEKFKGIPTLEIRGAWRGFDHLGRPQYGDASERAQEILEELQREHDVIFGTIHELHRFLSSP